MKKLIAILMAAILATSISFAQAGGGSTGATKTKHTTAMTSHKGGKKGHKGGKKGHKGGKKSKKGSSGTTSPPK